MNRWLILGLTLALAGAAFPARAQTSATVVEIAASLRVLVLLADGSVVALGNNRSGQLGRPKAIRSFLPAERVPLPAKAVRVAAGEDTSFALFDDGISGDQQPAPKAIALPGVEAYWLGGNFSLARTKDGTIWFWGEKSGAQGLLGVNGQQRVPAIVPMEKLLPR